MSQWRKAPDIDAILAMDDAEEQQRLLRLGLADPEWRLCNLYWIKTKGPEDDPDSGEDDSGLVVRFKPNHAQRRLLRRLWSRNIILKARQMGFTTLIQVLFLDFALFRRNINLGVIAHTDESAKKIFRKIKFAYDMLPPVLRAAYPLAKCTESELILANGSSIAVATSMRGDTLHYLHISEFGKICAKFPHRAEEIITGTIPAVAGGGMIFIESTAEGQDGDFFIMTQKAEANAIAGKQLTRKEYRFHFFPWFEAPDYVLDPAGVIITKADHDYFDELEGKLGITLPPERRAWWVSTRDNDFGGRDERMWQEYPSTPEEAFRKTVEGTYYRQEFIALRKTKRITSVPFTPGIPVNTFWDIGHGDGTAVWFHQQVGQWHHFIKFIEGWCEPYSYFVKQMQETGWTWGTHYLPHDGNHVRQGQNANLAPRQMLENLGLRNIEIVDRVSELQHGIQATRDAFALCRFDETECKEGLIHLEQYKRAWNSTTASWKDEPLKDGHTEAADAFRQFAQGYDGAADRTRPSEVRRKKTTASAARAGSKWRRSA